MKRFFMAGPRAKVIGSNSLDMLEVAPGFGAATISAIPRVRHPEVSAEEIGFAFGFLAARLRCKVPRRIVNPLAE
jgi:hypothetical protein